MIVGNEKQVREKRRKKNTKLETLPEDREGE